MLELMTCLGYMIPFSLRAIIWHSLEKDVHNILDVGCGRGRSILPIILRKRSFFRVGIDLSKADLKFSKRQGYYDDVVLADALYLPFMDDAFDGVLCIHVLEHFNKDHGLQLVNELERISTRQIIIVTPVGFTALGIIDEDPLQKHLAGWLPEELTSLGYKVRGMGSPSFLAKKLSYAMAYKISFIFPLTLSVYLIPDSSIEMICVKNNASKRV